MTLDLIGLKRYLFTNQMTIVTSPCDQILIMLNHYQMSTDEYHLNKKKRKEISSCGQLFKKHGRSWSSWLANWKIHHPSSSKKKYWSLVIRFFEMAITIAWILHKFVNESKDWLSLKYFRRSIAVTYLKRNSGKAKINRSNPIINVCYNQIGHYV